jgi:hypothetical protein
MKMGRILLCLQMIGKLLGSGEIQQQAMGTSAGAEGPKESPDMSDNFS